MGRGGICVKGSIIEAGGRASRLPRWLLALPFPTGAMSSRYTVTAAPKGGRVAAARAGCSQSRLGLRLWAAKRGDATSAPDRRQACSAFSHIYNTAAKARRSWLAWVAGGRAPGARRLPLLGRGQRVHGGEHAADRVTRDAHLQVTGGRRAPAQAGRDSREDSSARAEC